MADSNPYVGPASFDEKDRGRFFGRDEEARELSYLVIARRAVLLYAQSGAGKTSLLQAKLVPDFRDSGEMRVLPILRVSGDLAEGPNVFVENALVDMELRLLLARKTGDKLTEEEIDERLRVLKKRLPTATFTEVLAPFFPEARDGEEQIPHLLIFDQFEEIFTFRPELVDQRREFFEQLRDCLDAYPKLGLVLSMREDYLADMDSFAGFLPDRLRTRMRMERLSDKQAEEAIARPAQGAGKSFAPGVARKLTDDLRRVQAGRKQSGNATGDGHALGKYVEPVQLQIVCRQLWSKLPEDATEITAEHVEELARVDDALTNFYRDSLKAVREKVPKLSERALRQWFGEHLITSAKTRGLVYQGESETEELPNAAVEVLREKYILRADIRPSGTWYELAHDRLVEPILADNLKWRTTYKNPVAAVHQRWEDDKRSSAGLLNDEKLLADASEFDKMNPDESTAEERACLQSTLVEVRKARRRRQVTWGSVAGALLLVSGLAAYAERQAVIARGALHKAEEQQRIAESRALAAQAETLLSRGERESALDRAIRAYVVTGTEEAREAIFHAFPRVAATLQDVAGIRTAALSPDGRRILTASYVKTVFVWDAASGQMLAKLDAHNGEVTSAAFSPDGQRVVTSSDDKTARVWDASNGQMVANLGGHSDKVNRAVFSPDGQRILTASDDKTAGIWNAAGGELVRKLGGHGGEVTDAAFSPDGKSIVTASKDKTARVWRADTGQLVYTLPPHMESVFTAAFSPNGQRIVTASYDGTVGVWNAATGELVAKVGDPASYVSGVRFSPDSQRIVTASFGNTARVWNAATGQMVAKLEGHSGQVYSAAFSPDAQSIVTAGEDKTARVWNVVSGQLLAKLEGHTDKVTSAMFSPDGRSIVTVSNEAARVWHVVSGRVMANLESHVGYVMNAAFSPDGQQIVTGTADRIARVWNAASGQLLSKLQSCRGYVMSAAFSPDGRQVVAACQADTVQVWNTATGKAGMEMDGHAGMVTGAAFSPDGQSILAVYFNHTARVWNPASRLLVTKPDSNEVVGAAFSLDSQRILTVSRNGGVQKWNAASGQLVAKLEGPPAGATSAVFSPDRQRILTADNQGGVRIWNASDGHLVSSLEGRSVQVYSGAFNGGFSPDGQRIVTTSQRGAEVWDAATGRWLATLEGHGARVFSAAFSPDGQRIVTANGVDGTTHVYSIVTLDDIAKLLR